MEISRIVSAVIAAWQPAADGDVAGGHAETLPGREILRELVARTVKASLLREENRRLRFRLILRSPDRFPAAEGPPTRLLRLPFAALRPFNAQELRRLTPAVDHDRSLVGVFVDENDELQIWGLVHSGPRWLEQFYGGRGNMLNLPDSLILGVLAPGYMVISQGMRPLCAVEGGTLQDSRLNVFHSKWFPNFFGEVRTELRELHEAARAERGAAWAVVDPDFTRMVGRQMIQRLISTVQRHRQGGTLLIVSTERAQELAGNSTWLRLKYRFVGEEARWRFRNLIVRTMNRVAESCIPPRTDATTVGWDEYGRAGDPELRDLDDAIFELAHLIATLTGVDGAVVVTRRFELLGFGAEIAGTLPEVPLVAHALDLESKTCSMQPTEDVGMRHRSVYRLVHALPDVLGIVISQDGGAQFVRSCDSQVICWHHSSVTTP